MRGLRMELIVRGEVGVGDQSTWGELGWWRREGIAARRLLYTLQLSLNHSETARVKG